MSISIYCYNQFLFEDYIIYHILYDMKQTPNDIRKILSLNIKKHREKLGLSQEKLAENAELSTMMVKDIEGCRTWVSDKTLINLASALKTDIYRLLMPDSIFEEEIYKAVQKDMEIIFKKIHQDIDVNLNNAIKLWGASNY
ncbi:MAG: helix-turn-helix domain-containing protein [Treponema sp.]|nr:helix-turn-helix domain-containing protein [Treponema sp.]